MGIDVDKTSKIIQTMRSFDSNQWAVIIFLVVGCITAVWTVENRYAKIVEIEERFEKNQQQLESAYFLSLELFGQLPENQRRQIMEKLELSRQKRDKAHH